ncbi:MAG: hypothetical protein JWP87_2760 [Labilithrix sp.]|nr:hypothetical protein [Labilithrix sp.]
MAPSAEVEQIYLYCLGVAAARHGITLFGWMVMSNHAHLIVRDDEGKLPKFLELLHQLTAKAFNARLGRRENFWAAEQPSAVWLVESDDAFEKLVYLLANPVVDHLVERVSDWPGACSFRQHLSGKPVTVERPRQFFRKSGPLPARVTLHAARLGGFEDLTHEEWSAKIAQAVAEQEVKARAERAKKKMRVLGRKAVLATDPTSAPTTVEPPCRLRPNLACKNVERRNYELAALLAFRSAHRDARTRWIAGERRVLFPLGTYRMRDFGVHCSRRVAIVDAPPPAANASAPPS